MEQFDKTVFDPEYEKQALKQNGIYAYKKWLEYNNPTMFLIYF